MCGLVFYRSEGGRQTKLPVFQRDEGKSIYLFFIYFFIILVKFSTYNPLHTDTICSICCYKHHAFIPFNKYSSRVAELCHQSRVWMAVIEPGQIKLTEHNPHISHITQFTYSMFQKYSIQSYTVHIKEYTYSYSVQYRPW